MILCQFLWWNFLARMPTLGNSSFHSFVKEIYDTIFLKDYMGPDLIIKLRWTMDLTRWIENNIETFSVIPHLRNVSWPHGGLVNTVGRKLDLSLTDTKRYLRKQLRHLPSDGLQKARAVTAQRIIRTAASDVTLREDHVRADDFRKCDRGTCRAT